MVIFDKAAITDGTVTGDPQKYEAIPFAKISTVSHFSSAKTIEINFARFEVGQVVLKVKLQKGESMLPKIHLQEQFEVQKLVHKHNFHRKYIIL